MSNNTLIGVDLGFRHTGLVAASPSKEVVYGYEILGHTCVHTQKADKKLGLYVAQDDVSQCQLMFAGVMKFIKEYDPKGVVAELPSAGAKGARANRGMGIATGVIGSVASALNLPFVWVTPADSKVVLCGLRNASKDDMMNKVKQMYPDAGWPKVKNEFEHIADAVGALMVAKKSDIYKFMLVD